MTKKARILSHLKRGWPITPMQALKKYGCMSLSQRIGELIEAGWPIERGRHTTEDGAVVGKYRLDPKWREMVE